MMSNIDMKIMICMQSSFRLPERRMLNIINSEPWFVVVPKKDQNRRIIDFLDGEVHTFLPTYHDGKYRRNSRHPNQHFLLCFGIGTRVPRALTPANVIHRLRQTAVLRILINLHSVEEQLNHVTCDVFSKEGYIPLGVQNVIVWAKEALYMCVSYVFLMLQHRIESM